MRTNPIRYGGLVVLIGILMWIVEWRFELHVLNPFVLIAKVVGFIALVFWFQQIGPAIHRSWLGTLCLWFMLAGTSIACLFASLPFRRWMPTWANDGQRRWYFEEMDQREGDYLEWLQGWHDNVPLRAEAWALITFFAIILIPCAIFRMRSWLAVVVWAAGLLSLMVSIGRAGLLAPDYDVFQLGIALDSVVLSLLPFGLAESNAHSIFPLAFLAIIFGVSRVFLALPLAKRNAPQAKDETLTLATT